MVVEQQTGDAQEVTEKVEHYAGTLEAPEVETQEQEVTEAAGKVEETIEQAKLDGASKEELNELRGMLRTLRNENISLQARVTAAERVQKGDFGTEGQEVAPSELEVYQQKLQEAQGRDFSQIVAMMEINPKYEDLAIVCSESNVADVFESVARYRSQQNGTNFNTELLKAQAEVWSLPNPYKYMYDTIKEYHPSYAKKETTEQTKSEGTGKSTSAKDIVNANKAPESIGNLGGGGSNVAGGWTAARIDAMPESDLHTVPRDVYKKWLSGELN